MENNYILGIDVGTSTIKVFIGKLDINGQVLIAGSGTVPTKGCLKGIISDVQDLAVSISQAVECVVMGTGIDVKKAYIGLSSVEMTSIDSMGSIALEETAVITQEDINRVYQAAILAHVSDDHEVLHVLPKFFVVDKHRQMHLPLHQKGTHLEVEAHILAMPKILFSELVSAIEHVGIDVLGIVANSIMNAQTLASGTTKKILMDIGAGTTDLVLYVGETIYLSASLPLGGDYITSDIMKAFTIHYDHAEKIKQYYAKLDKKLRGQNIILDCNDYGTTDKQISYDFLYDIIESRIDEIVYLLHNYLEPSLMTDDIDGIFLTGGCAEMPNFRESIERKFKIPAQVVVPKELSSEYVHPKNSACYGIVAYAVKRVSKTKKSDNVWQVLIGKFKKLVNH